jgi:hypothetical protein
VGGAKIVGEASHYIYQSKTAALIYKHCPEARILVSLRNPTDRLFSEYLLLLREGSMTDSFAEYVARHAESYLRGDTRNKAEVPKLRKGLLAELLTPWIAQFGKNQVKAVLFDDLRKTPVETVRDIFNWLEIDADFTVANVHAQKGGVAKARWAINVLNSQNSLLKGIKSLLPKSAKVKLRSLVLSKILERPEVDAKTKEFLKQFYQDDVNKLSCILDRDLSEWNT